LVSIDGGLENGEVVVEEEEELEEEEEAREDEDMKGAETFSSCLVTRLLIHGTNMSVMIVFGIVSEVIKSTSGSPIRPLAGDGRPNI
jgi:hypothetical protein